MLLIHSPYVLFEPKKVDTRKGGGANQDYTREKEEGIEEDGTRERKRNMNRER